MRGVLASLTLAILSACEPISQTNADRNAIQPGNASEQASLADEVRKHPWNYDKSADEISGGSIISASSTSDNLIYFAPPYDGGSSLQIYLRKHPRTGTEAIISVSKGQIVCDISDGCPIIVRFDDAKARTFTGIIPADYSHTALFIRPASAFISGLMKSKKAVIEVGFYQEGSQQFIFNTQNLHWPPKEDDID